MTSLPGRLVHVFTEIKLWDFRIKAHCGCELELEVFLDINLVSQINELTKAMASLGCRRWLLLCQVFSVEDGAGKELGQPCLAVVSAPFMSSFRLTLSHFPWFSYLLVFGGEEIRFINF